MVRSLPTVVKVLGERWLHQNKGWVEEFITLRIVYYEQLEHDLALLGKHVAVQKLISCYQNGLRNRNEVQKTMLEIHGAALIGATATKLNLHVPRGDGSGRNFDIQAIIEDCLVSAESKTRKDEFPFNIPRRDEGPEGITGHFGARATVDPHDAADLGIPTRGPPGDVDFKPIPESTVIRQILSDGLAQLPQGGCNLLIFGHIEGDREQLERALFGAEMVGLIINKETKKVTSEWTRTPTGAFGAGPEGESFRALSGVLWIRVVKAGNLVRSYKLYPNPCAAVPIPSIVIATLERVMAQWEQKLPR